MILTSIVVELGVTAVVLNVKFARFVHSDSANSNVLTLCLLLAGS